MPIYEGDQQATQTTIINGATASLGAAAVKATVSAGALAYQFTSTFTFHNPVSNGGPITFRKGVSYQLDPTLRAALLAASAPMSAL